MIHLKMNSYIKKSLFYIAMYNRRPKWCRDIFPEKWNPLLVFPNSLISLIMCSKNAETSWLIIDLKDKNKKLISYTALLFADDHL